MIHKFINLSATFLGGGYFAKVVTILHCVSEVTLLIVSVVPFILRQRTTDPVYDKAVVGVSYLRFE